MSMSGAPPAQRRLVIDYTTAEVRVTDAGGSATHHLHSTEAFEALTRAWLRLGWELKNSYTFTWLGRPTIQLPEDLMRAQEAICQVRPDVIIECGVAHGGSLVFFASLCQLLGTGRVIGIDVDIRSHNRRALTEHSLSSLITLVDGSSIDAAVLQQVRANVRPDDRVMVFLDSNHSKDHVAAELDAYADLVSVGSYLVVADGIMEGLADSPLGQPDWTWNNPRGAVREFLARRSDFTLAPPRWPFNESRGLHEPVATYWPDGWLRRLPAETAP